MISFILFVHDSYIYTTTKCKMQYIIDCNKLDDDDYCTFADDADDDCGDDEAFL